jgi:type IV secretion system coupling TraD/TrwB family protein
MSRDEKSQETDRHLTYIGKTNWRGRGQPFGIAREDRRAHMYVVGKTGTGKSTLLEAMIRQDLLSGVGLAMFDPHGDLAERVRSWMPEERKTDLIYLDVPNPEQPFFFNPLAGIPPLRRSVTANGIVETLKKMFADSWGIRLEYILRNALLLLLDQPEDTIADVLRLFHDERFRKEAAEHATNAQVRRFWTTEFEKYPGRFRAEATSPIENKLGSFLVDPFVSRILTSPTSSFEPRELMERCGVLIVNLAKGKIGEAPAALFGSLLVSALGLAGLARSDEPGESRSAFYIYLDEFHTFTTLALANMLAELRKYGVALVLANQYLDQLAPEVRTSILGNVGSLVVFRVGATDALKLAKELGSEVDPDDLVFQPNRDFWVRLAVDGTAARAFTGSTVTLRERQKQILREN